MRKSALAVALAANLAAAGLTQATVYTDPGGTNDLTATQTYAPRMDIVSMEVTNTATDITFAVTVNAPVIPESESNSDWAGGRFFVFGMYTPNASGPANKNPTNISVSRNIYAMNSASDLGVNRRIFARAGEGGDFARYIGDGSTTTFTNISAAPIPFAISGNTFSMTVPLYYFGDFDSGGSPVSNSIHVGDEIFITVASTADVAGNNAIDSLGDAQLLPDYVGDPWTPATTIHSVSYTIAPVPEPATLGLAAVAGLGLFARRRRCV
jgi:hypothetical protein